MNGKLTFRGAVVIGMGIATGSAIVGAGIGVLAKMLGGLGLKKSGAAAKATTTPAGTAGFGLVYETEGEARRIGQTELPEREFRERLGIGAYEMSVSEARRVGELPEREFKERLAAYDMDNEARQIGADPSPESEFPSQAL
jgi:hypothetical protein